MWYGIQLITSTDAKKLERIQSPFLDIYNNRFSPGSNDYMSSYATLYHCLIYALCIREDISFTQFFISVLDGNSKSSIDIIGLRVPTRNFRDFSFFHICPFFLFLQANCCLPVGYYTHRWTAAFLFPGGVELVPYSVPLSVTGRRYLLPLNTRIFVSLWSVSSVAAL